MSDPDCVKQEIDHDKTFNEIAKWAAGNKIRELLALLPVPDNEGIRFGNCWIAYSEIEPNGPIAQTQFYKWAEELKAARK